MVELTLEDKLVVQSNLKICRISPVLVQNHCYSSYHICSRFSLDILPNWGLKSDLQLNLSNMLFCSKPLKHVHCFVKKKKKRVSAFLLMNDKVMIRCGVMLCAYCWSAGSRVKPAFLPFSTSGMLALLFSCAHSLWNYIQIHTHPVLAPELGMLLFRLSECVMSKHNNETQSKGLLHWRNPTLLHSPVVSHLCFPPPIDNGLFKLN